MKYFNELTLTLSRCASFVHCSIMVDVTWLCFDKSTQHHLVGHTTM